LAEHGSIGVDEMRRTFNCGVGMIVVVAAEDLQAALSVLDAVAENAWQIGQIDAGAGPVNFL
jgi:phosphoribosylformylglycinamidine cyclo-ligase